MALQQGRRTAAILLAVGFLSTGIMALISFPRSQYLVQMGIPVASYGLLLSAANAVALAASLALGRLVDRGHLAGLLYGCCAGSLLCHLAFLGFQSIQVLAAAFLVETVCNKLFTIYVFQLVARVFHRGYGAGLGVYKMVGSLAWALCAFVSGYILTLLSFRWLMAFTALLTLAKLVALRGVLHGLPAETPPAKAAPVGKRALFLRPRLLAALLLYLLLQLQSNGGFAYLQIYFEGNLGIDPVLSGIVISSSGLFEILLAFGVGKLSDTRGVHLLAAAGALLSGLRWVLLGWGSASLVVLLVTQLLHGVMICTISITFVSLVRRMVPPERAGAAYGLLGALASAGSILGASLFGWACGYIGMAGAYTVLGWVSLAGGAAYFFIDTAILYKQARKKEGSIRW